MGAPLLHEPVVVGPAGGHCRVSDLAGQVECVEVLHELFAEVEVSEAVNVHGLVGACLHDVKVGSHTFVEAAVGSLVDVGQSGVEGPAFSHGVHIKGEGVAETGYQRA